MIDFFLTYGDTMLAIASGVVSVSAMVAALTPTPADDGIVRVARKVIDLLAFNFGHAKNATRTEVEVKDVQLRAAADAPSDPGALADKLRRNGL